MPRAEPSSCNNTGRSILLGFLILLPVLLVLLPMEWLTGDESRTLCLYTNLTGHSCYGCGMTRAVASVMHGRLADAWHYNRLIVAVFPLLVFLWARWIRDLCRKTGKQQTTK